MTQGLATFITAGSATLPINDPISGLNLNIPVSVAIPTLNTTTGQQVMGAKPNAVPIKWDAARKYTGAGYASRDAEWHNTEILSSLSVYSGGGGLPGGASSGALYDTGTYVNLISIVDTGLSFSYPAFRGRLIGNDGFASEPAKAELGGNSLGGSFRRIWFGRRISYLTAGAIAGATLWNIHGDDVTSPWSLAYNSLPGDVAKTYIGAFTITPAITVTGAQTVVTSTTSIGNASTIIIDAGGANQETISSWTVVDSTHLTANFTKTHPASCSCNVSYPFQASAYKCGPFLNSNGGDPTRYGIECGHNSVDGGGHHIGDVVNEAYMTPSTTIGPLISPAGSTGVDSAYWDGACYDEALLFEFRVGTNGHDYASSRYFRRLVNPDTSVGPWYAGASHVQGPMFDGTTWFDGKVFTTWEWTSKNHNRAIGGDRYYESTEWGIFNADNPSNDNSDDPWDCLLTESLAIPVVPQVPTLSSKTSSTATLNVPLVASNSTRSYIAKLRPVVDGVDISAQDYTLKVEEHFDVGPNTNNFNIITITVTGLSTGVHLIGFKGINGAGSIISASSPTLSVTI